ncbi:hypothetical protein D0Z07_9074 [Hyphodiscus hymeniophilus]|uniref:Histidine acid phosphatase n=1 Tax=Hyphodiscus hymeniophilus TaxID=353542 RepID=A0A9P6SJQ4_9HELO|nr:hypothetical protein D0Z07_9074 [Hyphodiscus hymeniophilus]
MVHINHLILSAVLPVIAAQETILGVYIFHRHGDRSTKSYPPTHLTDLGYAEVFQSGSFYRSRYVDSNASNPIFGISSDLVKGSQLSVQSPTDDVLQNSASGFLQGLYPPVGATLGSETVANGSTVQSPLGGYQLIPVSVLAPTSAVSQPGDAVWLEGTTGCENAVISSNNYFLSQDFQNLTSKTASFYQSILPVVNNTFTTATDIYKNAYASKLLLRVLSLFNIRLTSIVWDLVQVSLIHNTTIQSSELLTPSNILQLQTLSDHHEFNLAYNASDPVRAIDGAVLAAQVVQALNATIAGKSTPSINVQLGEYANFLAFFGLAQLPAASVNFTGINNFASSMVFELVTNSTVNNTTYPSTDDISVRFLFANGTAGQAPLNSYPLFGQSQIELPWSNFVSEMDKFAIGSQDAWCSTCGAGSTACNTTTSATTGSSSSSPTAHSGGGISRAVDGVIGAMVTLAVILALVAALMLVGGFRLVRKGTGTANNGGVVGTTGKA